MTSLLDRPGLALYAIPAVWASALIPHLYAAQLMDKLAAKKGPGGKGFSQAHPRLSLAQVTADTPHTELHRRIIRAEGCQSNGFEQWGAFSAAIVCAQVAKLSPRFTNMIAFGYLVSRVLYDFIYIGTEDDAPAYARTAIYLGGTFSLFTLFIQSARALA